MAAVEASCIPAITMGESSAFGAERVEREPKRGVWVWGGAVSGVQGQYAHDGWVGAKTPGAENFLLHFFLPRDAL